MFYTPERLIYRHEQGIFGLDIWREGDQYLVHAVQLDAKHSVKGFSSHESRQTAITQAVEYVVQENRE